MSGLRRTYLALAVLGTAWPTWHFVAYLSGEGGTLHGMVGLWLANDATRGLTADLVVTATALTIWIIAEIRVRRNWIALAAIPATFLNGVSLGLPLYLFLRGRPVV